MIIQFPKNTTTIEDRETKEPMEALSTRETIFGEILAEAEAIQERCTDHKIKTVTPGNFVFNDDATITYTADDGYEGTVNISRYALSQLGNKIGVPGNYVQKCVDNGLSFLAAENVNQQIARYDNGFFMREYEDPKGGSRIRGVLSPRYSVYDTPDVLRMIGNTIDMSNYTIKGSLINEERLHMRFTSRDCLNIDGEDLFPGIFVDTSDVGRSTLIIQFGIYKLVCTNGLVVAKAGGVMYKQKHIGIDTKDFEYQIAASIKDLPTMIQNAEEWIKIAKKQTLDPEKMLNIMKNLALGEKVQDNVRYLMNERYGNSKWGFINGLTEVAQTYSLEKRLDIEKQAGNILIAA